MKTDFVEIFGNPWLAIAAITAVIMGYLTVNSLMIIWLERKFSARIQRRLGPTEVGPFGLLQTAADMLKLISKELLTPEHVHKPLYLIAPVLVFAPILALCSLFPVAESWVFFDYDMAEILPEAQTVLQGSADWMRMWPSTRIRVEGHCDERGTNEYNLALGARRARSVSEALVAEGVEAVAPRDLVRGLLESVPVPV